MDPFDDIPPMPFTKSKQQDKPKKKRGRPKKTQDPGGFQIDESVEPSIPLPPPKPSKPSPPAPRPFPVSFSFADDTGNDEFANAPTEKLYSEVKDYGQEGEEAEQAEEDEMPTREEAIEEYEKMWRENEQYLNSQPHVKKLEITDLTSLDDILKSLDILVETIEAPKRAAYAKQIWVFGMMGLGRLVDMTPYKPWFNPEASEENPEPKVLSKELCDKAIVEKAVPVIEDLLDMFPFLNLLSEMGDPRVQLAWACMTTAAGVYTYNTDPRFRKEYNQFEELKKMSV